MDDENKTVKLNLEAHKYIEALSNIAKEHPGHSSWNPEYGSFMIEGTPGKPFSEGWDSFLELESNMIERRQLIQSVLEPNQVVLSIPNFPLLGVNDFTIPSGRTEGPIADSLYIPDTIMNPHHRFATLTRNIRTRKGSHVSINIPVYKDVHTAPISYQREREMGRRAQDDHIYMDAMAFGMGMNCLQCTFQICNIEEARTIYDQFAVLAPIMLSLTAGTPILRGYLADIDARWKIIAGSVDDRTDEELGLVQLKNNKFVINKSRYDSIDCYISNDDQNKPEYNDLDLVYDRDIYNKLRTHGIDELMSRHIAHLFIRDPLVIYSDKIQLDNKTQSNHFENIQSTNWQTVRFKPPPPMSQDEIGWRVEFRPMEVQLTDFENAAFTAFIVIMTRVICAVGLNLYIPISKVDENMDLAHLKDAVLEQKFHWRKNIYRTTPKKDQCDKPSLKPSLCGDEQDCISIDGNSQGYRPSDSDSEFTLMSINEIMNGNEHQKGLVVLAKEYIQRVKMEEDIRAMLLKYMNFISDRASGKLKTFAKWQRDFVINHPLYQQDSIVSKEIAYDLIKKCDDITQHRVVETSLLGDYYKQ